ncbi:PREDICTED: uncharacterized protein LOC101306280 [Fragaria vesca subsp. vesca]|uniref:uncharacterized protein LOC101306280 n=1 Tax=Fragaria vesca subsp. vesca TaxID=101020 RepID=UPI0002C32808|nr:PREDICTED: uncharacterized protein LOC101306280 [Fragaria vesca subsp. vesca]
MSSSLTSQPPQQVSISMPVKLTGSHDYLLWKSFITPILNFHDILDLAEGSELCPPSGTEAYTHWTKKDQLLLGLINESLSEDLLLRRAVGCPSGRALWLVFEGLFAQKAAAHVKRLKDRLENLKMKKADNKHMHIYINEVKNIVKGLHAAGFPMEDREVVSCVLRGLPSEYEELLASIRNRPQPLRQQQLYKSLLQHRLKSEKIGKAIKIAAVLVTIIVGIILLLLL